MEPVYERYHEYLLRQSVIHADETTCQVLKEDGKTPESKSYIQLYTSGVFEEHRIMLYEYQSSRGGYHAAKFLADYHGFVHTDGPLADQSLPRQLTMPKTKDHIWRITFLMEDAPLVITQLKEPKGAKESAIVYTLVETAKANGLNIRLYLETVMTKMLDYKNEPDSIMEELMPWSEAMQKSCGLNNGTI